MTKILLVEDDKSLREIYGVRLQAEGYEITSAGNGEEALALAIKERPNLIISDVMMPKISGFDMLDILRSTTETKDIRVIMMTALGSEDQRQRGEALGADRYLVKSQVGIEDVVRTVHEVLGDLPGANAAASQQPHPVGQTTTPVPVAAPEPAVPSQYIAPTAAPIQPTPPQPTQPPQQPAPSMPTTPTPPPIVPVAPVPPQPQPMAQPTPAPQLPQIPAAPPQPNITPPAPAPAPQANPITEPHLPEPMAPFSSPRPSNLGDRIIQPLTDTQIGPPSDLADRMSLELSGNIQIPTPPAPTSTAPLPTPPPAVPAPPQPVAPVASTPQVPQMPPMPAAPQAQPSMPAPQSEQLNPATPQAQPMPPPAPAPQQPQATVPAPNLEFEETPRN